MIKQGEARGRGGDCLLVLPAISFPYRTEVMYKRKIELSLVHAVKEGFI